MRNKRLADGRPLHEIDHPAGNPPPTSIASSVHPRVASSRWFEHDGIAGKECGNDVPIGQMPRKLNGPSTTATPCALYRTAAVASPSFCSVALRRCAAPPSRSRPCRSSNRLPYSPPTAACPSPGRWPGQGPPVEISTARQIAQASLGVAQRTSPPRLGVHRVPIESQINVS